jgi:hypothetical protein
MLGCCAFAARGHATAAPPTKSLQLIELHSVPCQPDRRISN